ncbi:hypothetical protein X975_11725, partial [Stegodyphus mimosarum]
MKTFALVLIAAVLVAVCYARPREDIGICDPVKGEVFKSCGSACPDTCSNYNEVRPCTLQCVRGCFCPSGTVRRESDQYCVKPE